MTLAMALRAIDGLVLATDSRVTGPEGTADTSEKFLQVNRDIGVLTYGFARPGYLGISGLVDTVAADKLARFSDIDQAASEIFQEAYREWRQGRTEDLNGGVVGYIVAGYDSVETNQFQIRHYEIVQRPNETTEFRRQTLTGDLLAGQWHIARYLLTKLHYRQMTVDELSELAVFILAQTMAVENTVGGPLQLATVTITEGFQRIYEKEVLSIIHKNQYRTRRFDEVIRKAFLSEFGEVEGHND